MTTLKMISYGFYAAAVSLLLLTAGASDMGGLTLSQVALRLVFVLLLALGGLAAARLNARRREKRPCRAQRRTLDYCANL